MNENLDRSDVSLPVSQFLEIDRICRQFEAAWKAGQQPKVEDFLGRMEEPGRSQLRKELAAVEAEFQRSPELGSTKKAPAEKAPPAGPSLEEFIRRLTESGLMTSQEVQQFVNSIPSEQQPTAAEPFARMMFQKGLLTRFQAQAIYQGKTRGLVVGNYVVLDKLGKGGMGQVYKAQHRKMKRMVALKMLPSSATKSPDAVKRFQREVEAAAKLSHPNIVTAHDADEANGVNFLVMEHVDGQDLTALVKGRGPLPVAQAVDCTVQAARGLEYAHRQGVIHRDIKPSNLLLDKSGVVKILDMGLARMDHAAGAADDGLTQTGQVMGTLDYMAPEQAFDTHHADARSDIYSLGCTLCYLLTGRSPFAGETVTQKILAHREHPIPSLRAVRPDVPEWLDGVFQKMLAKRPGDRQQTMGQVMTQLQQQSLPETGPAVQARPGPGNVAETLSLRQGRVETSSEQIEVRVPGSSLSRPGREVDGEREGIGTGESISVGLSSFAPRKNAAFAERKATLVSAPVLSKGVKPQPWSRALLAWQRLARRQKIAVATAIGLLFVFVLLGVVLRVQTKEGTLLVEIDEKLGKDVQVAVSHGGEKVQVVDANSGWTISLNSGQYDLAVKGGDDQFQLDRDSVTVRHGDVVKVKLTLKRASAISNPKSEISNLKSAIPVPPPAIAPFDAQQARKHQDAWAKHLGVPVEITNSIGMKLVLIPPGEFGMGSTPEQVAEMEREGLKRGEDQCPWCIDFMKRNQTPLHQVRITKPFYLGMYEVTQEEYQRVMGSNPSGFSATGREKDKVAGEDTKRFPVENVLWDEAKEFCERLSNLPEEKAVRRHYQLPTEAQWEYACRAGTMTRYCFGDDPGKYGEYAWCNFNSGLHPHPVGRKTANPWALYDMYGNVWEWCGDWLGDQYYRESPCEDPPGPSSGTNRIFRGNSWMWSSVIVLGSSSYRLSGDSTHAGSDIGFRVAMTLTPVASAGSSSSAAPSSPTPSPPSPAPSSFKQFDSDRKAAEWVLSVGGSVVIAHSGMEPRVNVVSDLPKEPFRVVDVCLVDINAANDDTIKNLQDLTACRSIFINHTAVTDAGLKHLENLVSLRRLSLWNTKINGEGFKHLRKLPALEFLSPWGSPITDRAVESLKEFPALRRIDLSVTAISDAGMAHLGEMKRLRCLAFRWTKVTNRGLEYLCGMPELESLVFGDPLIDGRGVVKLAALPKLKELQVFDIPIDDAQLKDIARLERLTDLRLEGSRVTDEGLRCLKSLRELTILFLSRTAVTDEGMVHLLALPRLADLVLEKTAVSDRGLETLAKLKTLRSLNVSGTKITDAGLDTLAKLKTLQNLYLQETKVTAAGVAKLQAALPQCKISGAPTPTKQ